MAWKDIKRARLYYRARKRARYAEAIQLLGGRCVVCGAVQDLEIDHVLPSEKEFRITDVLTMSHDRRMRELAKCQLLCTDDHADKTADDAAADVVPF